MRSTAARAASRAAARRRRRMISWGSATKPQEEAKELTAAGEEGKVLPCKYRGQLFINNEWRDAAGGATFPVVNPATEEVIFECAKATAFDVDDAVEGARRCFREEEWCRPEGGKKRAEMMRAMAEQLRKEREHFAVLETLDNGKPVNESRADVDVCISLFDYYAKFADNFETRRTRDIDTEDKDFRVRYVREAMGVVGMVTPWNFPLMQAAAKVAPALAAGCSMVLKPSSVCPGTCLRLGDLALAAGLPPGALQIISGTGSEAGAALLGHKGLDHLSFTGSSGVGHTVLHAAADRLVPSMVELGGKGAIVVFDDVDINAAVDWIMLGIFLCAGQSCSATSRLVVQHSSTGFYERLMERLVEETEKLRIGSPLAENTNLGPLTSKEQREIVGGFVDRARAEGAEVLCGGEEASFRGKGWWYKPTILTGLKSDAEAWREEIFGPVLCVAPFRNEAHAVELANDTPYGLGNAVMTKDEIVCERVAQQLHAGVVWKNCSNAIPTEAPFGGFGRSGFGKEYGELGFEEYVKTKVITSCQPGFSWEWYVKRTRSEKEKADKAKGAWV